MVSCHLGLEWKSYVVAEDIIGFELYNLKRKLEISYIIVSMTHTITLGISKNKISRIVGTIFNPKKHTLFSMIATKPVDIVFDQIINNIKDVNQNYLMQ